MSFIPSLITFAVIALIGWNAVEYYQATGTPAQRLAAAFKDSMTKFVLFWGILSGAVLNGVDQIAAMTVDPMWHQMQDTINTIIPELYHKWVALVAMILAWFARNRTLPKS